MQQAGAPAASQPAVAQAAPAAGAGAAPSAELAASLQNPAALQRIWQAALSTLKKNKAAYGVLFLNTKALYRADKGLLVIEFPAENSFAFKAVQKPDVQEAVLTALTQACGAALPFTYVQGPGAEPAASAVAPVAEAAAPAAASSAPVASAAAPVQASPTAAQQPAPQPSSPAAVPPEPDPAPLDAYDLPPYDDEIVPYDDYDSPAPQSGGAGAAPASSGAPSGAGGFAAPSGQPSPTPAPAASAQPGLPPEPDARTSPSVDAMAPVQSPDELEAILAAGFGDGVIVEEVRE